MGAQDRVSPVLCLLVDTAMMSVSSSPSCAQLASMISLYWKTAAGNIHTRPLPASSVFAAELMLFDLRIFDVNVCVSPVAACLTE